MEGKRRRRSWMKSCCQGICCGLLVIASLMVSGGCGGARSFLAPRRTAEPQLLGRVDPEGGTAEKLARGTRGLAPGGDARLATNEAAGRSSNGAAIRGQSVSSAVGGPRGVVADDTAPVPRPLDPTQTRSGADLLVLNPPAGASAERAMPRQAAAAGSESARAVSAVPVPGASGAGRAVEPPPAEPAPHARSRADESGDGGTDLVIEPPAEQGREELARASRSGSGAVSGSNDVVGDRIGDQPLPAAPGQRLDEVRDLVQRGLEGLSAIGSYRVTLQRQERVGATLQPDETVVVNIRREPRAVRLEWPSGPNKGREVIYDSGGDQQMHIHTPNALPPLVRLTLPPNSPMVLRNSRHPITEAGLDTVLASLDRTIERHQKGEIQPGEAFEDQGLQRLDPDGATCRLLVQKNARGEKWTVALDPETGLPVMVLGMSEAGELLERHRFSGFTANVEELQTATAFQPNARWGEPKSIISKLPLGLLSGQPAKPEEARR